MGNYDIKRAFIAGATVRAEFPHLPVGQCIPRGPAGDRACEIWIYASSEALDQNGVIAIPVEFDMVLFLLFLGEAAVRP